MPSLFGDRLRRARLAAGLSQLELADKLQVSQPSISLYETGTAVPDQRLLGRIEAVLGPLAATENQRTESVAVASDVFGAWLIKARTEAGMSKAELADAAGISLPTIYNIESGRSSNPQDETKKRLEKALKAKIPEDVKSEIADEQEIVGLGSLKDFDPYGADVPTRPGVYVFYDVSDRPIYIGKAENISQRVRDHEEKFWFKRPIVDRAAFIEIKDSKLRHQVEQVLIKFLKSNAVINKQSVDR
jgi:transcriptional regulator with XRE-family HTH domain